MRRLIVILVLFSLVFCSTAQAEVGKKMRNGLIGFIACTACTYVLLRGINTDRNTSLPKRTEAEMLGTGAGVGVIGGFTAYLATIDRSRSSAHSIVRISKGKPVFNYPQIQISSKRSGRQIKVHIFSITK